MTGMSEYIFNEDLTFATVSQEQSKLQNFIEKSLPEEVILNLDAIQRSDSAGLALMIQCLRWGKRFKKKIIFKAIPEQMKSMMCFCNVLPFFEEKKWTN